VLADRPPALPALARGPQRDPGDAIAADSRARALLRCHRIAVHFGPLAAARALAWYDAQRWESAAVEDLTPPV
jgi:hypothetical protein